jgi:hypothetical protein
MYHSFVRSTFIEMSELLLNKLDDSIGLFVEESFDGFP